MGSQSEKEAYHVREEQHDGGKPAVRSDSIHKEAIVESRYLAEVASSTVSIWLSVHVVYRGTSITKEFMLQQSVTRPEVF